MKRDKLLFLTKLIIQNLRKNKIRTMLTILTIILCTTLISGLSNDIITSMYSQYYTARASAGIWLFAYTSESKELSQSVLDIVDIDQETTKSIIGIAEIDELYTIELMTYSDFNLCPEYLYKGNYPSEENEVMVTREYIQRTQKDIGDTIEMTFHDYDNQEKTFHKKMKISGIIQFTGYRQESRLIDKFILHSSQRSSQYTKYIAPKPITEKQLQDLLPLFENDLTGAGMNGKIMWNLYLGKPIYTFDNISEPTVIMLMSMFIMLYYTLRNLYSVTFKERQHYYGILSSVGAPFSDIRLISILESLLYSILSIPIGLLLGYYGLKYIYDMTTLNFLRTQINGFPHPLQTSFIMNIFLSVCVVIILLFSALSATKFINNKSIIHLLKSSYSHMISIDKKQYKSLFNNKPAWISLMRNYQTVNRKKYLSIIGTLSFSIIFFNVGCYDYSIPKQYNDQLYERDSILVWMNPINLNDSSQSVDSIISHITKYNQENPNIISMRMNFGNLKSLPLHALSQDYLDNFGKPEKMNTFVNIYGVTPDIFQEVTGQDQPVFLNKRDISLQSRKKDSVQIFNSHQIIPLQFYNNYVIDDVWYTEKVDFNVFTHDMYDMSDFGINDSFEASKNEFLDLTIVAPYDLLINENAKLNHLKNNYANTSIKMFTNDHEKLISSLMMDSQTNKSIADIYNPLEDNPVSFREYLIQIMTLFILLICMINLSMVIVSNTLERNNDYAILESLGIKDKDMKKMIFSENMMIILIALGISIPITILTEGIMYYYQFTYMETFSPPYYSLLFIILISICIVLLMSQFTYLFIKSKRIIHKMKNIDA